MYSTTSCSPLSSARYFAQFSAAKYGDVAGNQRVVKQQWIDYGIATGLHKREESLRLATLRSAMGKECLQILLNLNLSEEYMNMKKIDKCLEAPQQKCGILKLDILFMCNKAKNLFKVTSQDWET